jgi:hypothetical protein
MALHGFPTEEDAKASALRFVRLAEQDRSTPPGMTVSVLVQLYDAEGEPGDVHVLKQITVTPPAATELSLARAVCWALAAAVLLLAFIFATGGEK